MTNTPGILKIVCVQPRPGEEEPRPFGQVCLTYSRFLESPDRTSETERPRSVQDADIFRGHPVRTAIGKFGGCFKDIAAPDLGARATAEGLGKLRPALREDGTTTAGNAPELNSGAAAMILPRRRSGHRFAAGACRLIRQNCNGRPQKGQCQCAWTPR
ncbi:hypothetical protein [Aquicoccus sp.]|uniref:thiolase family protein n=1 Tax=Aquicoccus sp. TaxID=2055851 RepID=UPI00356A9B55